MRDTDSRPSEPRLARAERAIAAIAGASILLLAVYAIGASGIPGEAFVALIDWAVSRGFVAQDGPVIQVALAAMAA